MNWLDLKTVLTIFHLLGVALGAGGAYLSDAMFFSSVKDERIDQTELRFMRIGSTFVWVGLSLLILSGLGLFLKQPDIYLASSKFLTKMTVVMIILINGIIFHSLHLPRIHRHAGEHFPSSDEFMRRRPLLLASGAISFVSWTSALVLGVLRSIPYGYFILLAVYLLILITAITSALVIFKHHPKK